MDPTLIIILRLIHIVVGVFWVGGAALTAFFVLPTARAAGPIGGQFVGQLVQRTHVATFLTTAGLINVLSGLALYWGLYSGGPFAGPAAVFAIGGAIAILVLVLGFTIAKPTADKLGALGARIAAQGTPPTAEQNTERAALSIRLGQVASLNSVLLLLSVAFMAVARYV